MSGFYRIARAIVGFLLRLWYKCEFYGTENQPTDRGYVICCNHRSMLDPIFLALKTKKQIHYMAKEELFKNKLFGRILKALGAFPVSRGTGDLSAIKQSVDLLRSGHVLGLFPEGTRSKTDELLRFKAGVVVVAAKGGADVLPASVWYTGKGFRSKMIIRYGEIIPKEQLQIEEHSSKQIKGAVLLLQTKIEALVEESKVAN